MDTSTESDLSIRSLTHASGHDISEVNLLNFFRINFAASKGSSGSDSAEVGSSEVFELAHERADGSSLSTDDDSVCGGVRSLGNFEDAHFIVCL